MPKHKRALYVTYNAATEPLVRSQVLPYIQALSDKGIEFCLLSFEKDAVVDHAISEQLKRSDIGWVRMRFHSRPLALAKAFDVKFGGLVVLWLCLKKRIDVVHARGIMGAVISILPAKLSGARFIFDMKSSLAEAYRLNGRIKRGSLAYRVITFLERWCVLHADEVIVETASHKDQLERAIDPGKRHPRITVLPCCVDTNRFAEKSAHTYQSFGGKMKLVYLGSLSGWYMIEEMIDFFETVKEAHPGSEFLFLTDDKDGGLDRMVREKKIEGITIKKVAYGDVPKNLWDATAGILFKWPFERLDSFPIKIAEYLAAGLPVVINAGMGDVEALARENRVGVVARSCDKDSYRAALRDLENIIKEGRALQERCEAVAAKHLSTSNGLSTYESVYGRFIAA